MVRKAAPLPERARLKQEQDLTRWQRDLRAKAEAILDSLDMRSLDFEDNYRELGGRYFRS
ncbi:uncharacterized protein CC84DRAFT_1166778 [Paraphaeosphaeria sporulosa]|uniref:Uncharacterized protein n=1 Tax=Paraphaeosphaeria sporulosa TaxID=1460663 RepID=A0A177C819_9PLEO|nr:uncharacterized protein CC84DRAFT_1166778 [Paraphaeosphaeria sporulosa]OAG02999.1 hypothetical protein CC84DRAFT_1166778 [Paraphaeosphaeria sporulosa]